MSTPLNINHKKFLGCFSLAMINVSAIISLRNLPLMAKYGLASVSFYALAAILFFIPVALCCAELATGWPKKGGVYAWVKEAFGPNWGFLAIWLEWIESVVWLPTVLSFMAATFAYIVNPSLAENKYYLWAAMLIILWSSTLINFLGMKTSSWISSLGVLIGSVLPGVMVIVLGAAWILLGKPSEMTLSSHAFIPELHPSNMVFFAGVLLGFAGMEVAAYHAQEAKNPQRDYPRAILIATIIILFVSIFGSLAIAIVVPQNNISLISGVMQAYQTFFSAFGLDNVVPWIALIVLIGASALLNSWIIGPSRGLLASAQQGDLPRYFRYSNRHNSPTHILLAQAVLGTLLSSVFLFMPSVNSSYWMLNALTAQLILLMYLLVFSSVIRLRYTQADSPRSYKIPGGKVGVWLVGGLGIFACCFAIFIGFIPPAEIQNIKASTYSLSLGLGIVTFSLFPAALKKILR